VRLPTTLALVPLLAAACTADLTLSPGTRITCTEGDGCPEGFVCNPAGRCEATAALDRAAPALVEPPTVTPAAGREETVFEVAFEVSETLLRPPEVTVDLGVRQAALEPGEAEPPRYLFQYAATGGEPEGEHDLTIVLTDESGNEGRDTSASLVLDFTPPRVEDPGLERTVLKDGATTRLGFSVSEPLPEDAPPVVRLLDGAAWTPEEAPEGEGFSYGYEAHEGTDAERAWEVVVELADRAGNTSSDVVGTVTFDFTDPSLATAEVSPPIVRQGAVLRVHVQAAEDLGPLPQLSALAGEVALPFPEPDEKGRFYEWVREIGPPDREGEYRLEVALEDLAGNTATVPLEEAVRIDKQLPGLVPGSARVDPGRELSDGAELVVAFTATEALAAAPRIRLGASVLGEAAVAEEGSLRYGLSYAVSSETWEDGAYPLVVELVDEAGNRFVDSRTLGTVTLDFSPPELRAAVEPRLAGARDLVQVTVSSDEPLAEGEGVLELQLRPLDGGEEAWRRFAGRFRRQGLGYRFARAVTAGEDDPPDDPQGIEDGRWELRVRAQDLLGNGGAWTKLDPLLDVDGTPPALVEGGVAVAVTCPDPDKPEVALDTGTCAKDGSTVELLLSVTEPLAPEGVTVRIGELALPAAEEPGTDFAFSYRVDSAELEEGLVSLIVELEDAAGNLTLEALGTLTLDYTSPAPERDPTLQREDLYEAAHGEGEVFAARGSEVVVVIAVDEPAMRAQVEVRDEAFLPTPPVEEPRSLFRMRVPDRGVPGDVEAVVRVTDLAGNVLSLPAGAIHYDYTPPPPPDLRPGRSLYRRVPWGDQDTFGVPEHTVFADAGSVDPWATVVVLDNPMGLPPALGRGEADEQGGFGPFGIAPTGDPTVYAFSYDRAGNPSDPAPFPEVEWVATLAHRLPGSPRENPNALRSARWAAPWLLHPEAVEERGDALEMRDAVDGFGVTLKTEGGGAWRLAGTAAASSPTARAAHGLAFDAARNRLVLFGGSLDGELTDELWERRPEGRRWELRCGGESLCPGPPETVGAPLVYDTARGRAVLFHGTASSDRQETWEWDGLTGEWESVWEACTDAFGCPRGELAPCRTSTDVCGLCRPALAYDSARARPVLVECRHTWEWDADERSWELVSAGAPARVGAALAYDSRRDRLLLLGGDLQIPEPGREGVVDDLWEYDPATRRWEQVAGTGVGRPGPPAMEEHVLVYDPVRGRAIAVGGSSRPRGWDGTRQAETWEWSPATGEWEQTCGPRTDCGGPPGRARAAATWDGVRERLVLHGGELTDAAAGVEETELDDLWEYDGRTRRWVQVGGADVSFPRLGAWDALAFDTVRERAVLHGVGPDRVPQTWEWDPLGEAWWLVCGAGCAAPPAGFGVLVFDERVERTLLFGPAETWAWDGAAGTWELLCGEGTGCDNPRWLGDVRAAWDGERRRAVVVSQDGAVRELDALRPGWTDLCTPGHACTPEEVRQGFALGWAGEEGGLLLHGGWTEPEWDVAGPVAELLGWSHDAAAWELVHDVEIDFVDGPPARHRHAAAYDEATGGLVVFGGDGGALSGTADTWEWRPAEAEWLRACDARDCAGPAPRYGHAMAWDGSGGRVVLHGGEDVNGPRDDTWLWSRAEQRPAQQLVFPRFSVPAGERVTLSRLTVRAWAGGAGRLGDGSVDGARLRLWDEGAWVVVADNDASPEEPGLLAWATSEPALLGRQFRLLDDQLLALELTPVGDSGGAGARLATDYLELVVRYDWWQPEETCELPGLSLCVAGGCYPDAEAEGGGVCLPEGEAAPGDACEEDTDCQSEHICRAVLDGPSRCLSVCGWGEGDTSCDEGSFCHVAPGEAGFCVEETDCAEAHVAAACAAGWRDGCTCAAADPCDWADDARCDHFCVAAFPDDHLDESWDCDCDAAWRDDDECVQRERNPCTCDEVLDPCGWLRDGTCDAECNERFPHLPFDDSVDCWQPG